MKNFWIIGSGTLAELIVSVITEEDLGKVCGFFDDTKAPGVQVNGIPVLGTISQITIHDHPNLIIAIGDPSVRKSIYKDLKKRGFNLPNVISKSCYLSKRVYFDDGVFIAPRCVILSGSKIGSGCCILSSTTVNQDVTIESFTLIGAGTLVGNSAIIGEGAHLKLGSIVKLNEQIAPGHYNG